MFSRFTSTFSRVFRLRNRRGAKENASSTPVSRQSSFEPPPSKSRQSRRPTSAQLKPLNTARNPSTARPRSSIFRSLLTPIAQSPTTTIFSKQALIPAPPTPILVIEHDLEQPTLPSPPAPALAGDSDGEVVPQSLVDGVSLREPSPVPTSQPHSRRVSFQLPITHTEERPESPVSMCSTLVTDAEEHTQVQAETGLAVVQEQTVIPEVPDNDSGPVRVASAESHVGPDDVVYLEPRRTRPVSLLSPLPVQMNASRFSLPAGPAATTMLGNTPTRIDKRESKRASLIFGSGSTPKESRMSRWSRELSKPETQEVLRVLRGL